MWLHKAGMKLVWVSPVSPYPPVDGVAVRSWNLLKGLNYLGWEIYLVCYGEPDRQDNDGLAPLIGVVREAKFFPLPTEPGRISWAVGKVVRRSPHTVFRHFSAELAAEVARLVYAGECGLLVCDQIQMARMCLQDRVPKVLNANDSFTLAMRREARIESRVMRRLNLWLEGAKLAAYERRIFPQFRCVVMVSDTDAAFVRSVLGVPNVVVIGNGVDTRYFDPVNTDRPPDLAEKRWVAFTGCLGHPPNVRAAEFLCREVMPRVLERIPDAGLILAGADPAPQIRRLAAQRDYIHLTGTIPDLRPFLRAAEVYACPLFSGSGIKNKLLEAMAMRLPIVATSLAAEALVGVRDGEELVLADDADTFAASVIRLMQDGRKREKLGVAARNYVVRNHSWSDRCSEFSRLLAEVAGIKR